MDRADNTSLEESVAFSPITEDEIEACVYVYVYIVGLWLG